ncbi:hypothetical protein [Massilia aquatica]|uniref:Uncharacterized protein n=1 Tax=Massilia aquatica TaxID=2609000 RepID=A0ABX0MIU4_9BURK|nr:hypothetical protein [Massilia aquatica]NHZ44192.1 hypothetical protein [Massilia aquatica]
MGSVTIVAPDGAIELLDYSPDVFSPTDFHTDFDALATLYCIDPAMLACEDKRSYNVYRVEIDGILVRFMEDRFFVSAMVEGRLADERLRSLQQNTLATLCQLEQAEWHIVD